MTIAVQLQAILLRALRSLPEPLPEGIEGTVSPAADARFGDYQANAAMTLAKSRRTNPRALATQIVEALRADPALEAISAPPEIAGAGFINFRLKPEFLARELAALDADPAQLGLGQPELAHRVVIDFSGPNIAKPMHVGHLRSTIIGDCLARVARFVGYEVVTDNHLGDWGTQFGKVIYGWKHFLNRESLAKDPLAELVRVYQIASSLAETNPSLEVARQLAEMRLGAVEEMVQGIVRRQPEMPAAAVDKLRQEATAVITEADRKQTLEIAQACRHELAKLQAGDAENLGIWQQCVDLSRAELDRIYDTLGIRFDHQYGESFFNPVLVPLVARLEQTGVAEWGDERDGKRPLVVHFPDDAKLAEFPAMIRKGDGAFNYTTTDIATYEQRVNELGADALWYVVGAPQSLHFEQLNAVTRRMGYTVPLTHIPFGSILGEDRKIMRTRSGENVALRDLLDEAVERARQVVEEKNKEKATPLSDEEMAEVARVVGLGAVKYAELSQHRLTDYVFSWSKMLSFQGNTAPYLQNAYVRIRSIFRRGGLDPATAGTGGAALKLSEPAELELAKKLAQFAETVPTVLEDFRPNLLANYLYELAGTFHAFFEACPVLKAEEGVQRETRLALCRVAMRTLRAGLGLLGIEVPERM